MNVASHIRAEFVKSRKIKNSAVNNAISIYF